MTVKINKSIYKNIAYSYSIREPSSAKGTIILLDGMPSKPGKKTGLMADLYSKGYDVFFPRYEGTFESKGVFLQRSPTKGVEGFINQLTTGLAINNNKYSTKKIFLLGASFGGGIALSVANNLNPSKVCAVSPVLSFKAVKGIDTLEKYILESYPAEYRFESSQWKRLINDDLYCPLKEKIHRPKKILIVTGSNDDQIPISGIKSYAKKNKTLLLIKQSGHLTLSKLDAELLANIDNFFVGENRSS